MEDRKTYTLALTRDESGWWTGQLDELSACITQGRTIEQTRERMRDALGLFLDDEKAAAAATFVDRVVLGDGLEAELEQARALRTEADAVAERARTSTTRVLEHLAVRGIGVRDAAVLVGISHQRVAQLVPGKSAAREGRARTSVAAATLGRRGGTGRDVALAASALTSPAKSTKAKR